MGGRAFILHVLACSLACLVAFEAERLWGIPRGYAFSALAAALTIGLLEGRL